MFAEIVRANRRRLGLTQEQLATAAGLNVRSIRKIETGRITAPRASTVRLLADAFGLAGADRERFCRTATGEATGPRHRPQVPAQLPAAVAAFTGREEHLAYLDRLLDLGHVQQGAVVISALSGTAGVGKTALAVHWCHRAVDRFPDGQLYLNLRGYGPELPLAPADALAKFLSALGTNGRELPRDLDDRAARYRSEIAGRRMLILLDNAVSVEQVRPLLPGTGSSIVVVTSRDRLAGLVAVHGAHRVDLDVLSAREAATLLRRLIGPRLDAEPAAAATLADQCARLPLALRIAAELAVTRSGSRLADLVIELQDQQRRLELFEAGGDPHGAVKAVFSWSTQRLPPAAARTFRLLGLHPGPDFDVYATAAVAGTGLEQAQGTLDLLVRAHLSYPAGAGRYAMHDLLRAYAAHLCAVQDTVPEQQQARQRLLDHYLHTAHAAAYLVDPYRRPLAIPEPRPGACPRPLDSVDQATAWLVAELATLPAVATLAASSGYHSHAWRLAQILLTFLDSRGYWHEATTIVESALAAAEQSTDLYAQAQAHHMVGVSCARRHEWHDAQVHLQQALNTFAALDLPIEQARSHMTIAAVIESRYGTFGEPLRHAEQALALSRAASDPLTQGRALNLIGWCHVHLDDPAAALSACAAALAIQQEIGDIAGAANSSDTIGRAYHLLGDHRPAIASYQQALRLYDRSEVRLGRAETLDRLGDTHLAADDAKSARASWRQAITILDELGDAQADQIRAKLGPAGRQGSPGS